MQSVFDPDAFMQQNVDGAHDTKFEPVPTGEYPAICEKIDVRSISMRDGTQRVVMDLTWDIQDEEVKASMGRDKLTVRQSLFLDTTPAGGLDLGKGKNVGLGKVRAALGQNNAGWSPAMLSGAGPALVNVGHRPDKNDPSVIYAEVKTVGQY